MKLNGSRCTLVPAEPLGAILLPSALPASPQATASEIVHPGALSRLGAMCKASCSFSAEQHVLTYCLRAAIEKDAEPKIVAGALQPYNVLQWYMSVP